VTRAASGALALVAATTIAALAGCGSDDAAPAPDYTARAARACAGATAGAQAMAGSGGSTAAIISHIKGAEAAAARAAKALDRLAPPQRMAADQAAVVRSIYAQSLRLRLVREQIARGSDAEAVIEAARPGLDDGDDEATERLKLLGVTAC
jgi:hypothetical protein